MRASFEDWSPAQLAFVLGYVIDLRTHGMAGRSAHFVGPTGRDRVLGHAAACERLVRLAVWRGLDPTAPPTNTPRALINGKPQA